MVLLVQVIYFKAHFLLHYHEACCYLLNYMSIIPVLLFLFFQLKEFILTCGGAAAPAFARALEIIQANINWLTLFEHQFYQWLRKAPDG